MKLEYADKINSLLQCFHFNKEFLEWNHDYSLQLLRHGVSHLYHFAMLQGENDECTLKEPATSLFPSPMGISLNHTTCYLWTLSN